MSIALVGTRGVPARYGGFETCVEEVGRRLVDRGHRVVVYCRRNPARDDEGRLSEAPTHLGMQLVHLPAARKRSLETLSHTGLSVMHLVKNRTQVAIVFNSANAPWLPVIRAARIPVATHVDGLEWKRAKWGPNGRRYYLIAERLAVRLSDALIADAAGIAEYYEHKFGVRTEQIAYGAPSIGPSDSKLSEFDLKSREYHLVVARFEPENHVDVIVDGYTRSSARLPLVVVGSAPYSEEYTRKVRALADDRVRLVGGVWDQELLDQLYANAFTYMHGHSVGGTNPSLLRAIGADAAVSAFDVGFNREVLGGAGRYFHNAVDLAQMIEEDENNPIETRSRGAAAGQRAKDYDWDDVADRYELLCRQMNQGVSLRRSRNRHTGGFPNLVPPRSN
jgi:glycosyltransferase involved in cell wall biosynthesis